jgi:hypothetical protein
MASHPAASYSGIPSGTMYGIPPCTVPTRANECGGLVQTLRDTQLTDHLDPSDALCTAIMQRFLHLARASQNATCNGDDSRRLGSFGHANGYAETRSPWM